MGGGEEEREKCGRDEDKCGSVGGAGWREPLYFLGWAIFVCMLLSRPAHIIFACGSVKWPVHEN